MSVFGSASISYRHGRSVSGWKLTPERIEQGDAMQRLMEAHVLLPTFRSRVGRVFTREVPAAETHAAGRL
jgi:hypothetical protein